MRRNLKRNIVIVAVLVFVGAAVYLNWSYNSRWGTANAAMVAAVGLALLLWPSGQSLSGTSDATEATEEARLEGLLSQMEGVGRIEVLLSDSGAAVVCQGADSVTVRLNITQAVRCYTGLGADKVMIFKMNESEG